LQRPISVVCTGPLALFAAASQSSPFSTTPDTEECVALLKREGMAAPSNSELNHIHQRLVSSCAMGLMGWLAPFGLPLAG